MTTHHRHLGLPGTEPEFRAQRLGFALNSLAAELVAERRKVAQLRKEIRQLNARLESQRQSQSGDGPVTPGSQARATAGGAEGSCHQGDAGRTSSA